MSQFARPSADTYNGDSYTNQAGSGSSIFNTIDEVSTDDADYIQSPATPSSDVYVTKLTSITDPVSSSSHIVNYRYGTDQASGGETLDLIVELRQGYTNEASKGTLIASKTVTGISGSTVVADSFTLSSGEADSITDYTSLYLRFVWNKP